MGSAGLRRHDTCGGSRPDGKLITDKNSKDRVAPETAGKPTAFLAVFFIGLNYGRL